MSALPEIRRLTALALPIVATQVGSMMLGVVDMLMVGQLGRDTLAAAALGNMWAMGTLVIGMGVVLGVDPLLTQAHGAGDGRTVGLTLQRGLVLSALIGVPTLFSWMRTEEVLLLTGQSPALAAAAQEYVTMQLPSAFAFLGFTTLRAYLTARSIVGPALWVTLAANLLNVLFNWVLIYGHLGSPALGLRGAGIATGVTRTSMLIGLALIVWRLRLHAGAWLPWSRAALSPAGLATIVALGVPIGVQLGLETWAFQGATLLAGWLGETELAANSIVLNMASLSFNVPLGIALASVTRVGNLLGAGEPRAAQHAAWVALGFGGAVMMVSALLFVVLRETLPMLYSQDPAVIAVASGLLPIAAAFQLLDGIQVVGGGILRGMGRTRPAAVFNLLGYYAIGLPVGYWLAFRAGFGVEGIWWGLTAGLAVVAASLVAWIRARGPATM